MELERVTRCCSWILLTVFISQIAPAQLATPGERNSSKSPDANPATFPATNTAAIKWATPVRSPAFGAPPICEGSTFCEQSSNYPVEIIQRQIEMNPSLLAYSSSDLVSSLAHRVDVSDVETLCLSTERVVYPKSGETINKNWLFIVNQQNFTQGVRIETCVEEDGSCKVIDGFAEGYTTSCKQKYIYRELSALAPDGTISREYFRFPASCCCHVQFTASDEHN